MQDLKEIVGPSYYDHSVSIQPNARVHTLYWKELELEMYVVLMDYGRYILSVYIHPMILIVLLFIFQRELSSASKSHVKKGSLNSTITH